MRLHIMFCQGINLTPSIPGFTSKQAYKMGIPAIGIVAVLVANVTFSDWQSPPGKTPCACMQHLPCSAAPYHILFPLTSSLHIHHHMSLTADPEEQHKACKSHSLVVTVCRLRGSGGRYADTQCHVAL